jgi:hypothetical protein
MHGEFPTYQIDHIDGDGLNNRLENLRDVTQLENLRNMTLYRNNTSGRIGVCFVKREGKWCAQIGTKSGSKHLGHFSNFDDAVTARKAAEVELGYHENHGRVS